MKLSVSTGMVGIEAEAKRFENLEKIVDLSKSLIPLLVEAEHSYRHGRMSAGTAQATGTHGLQHLDDQGNEHNED